MKTHEEQVEDFYSHGADKRKDEADGFLSFGYRTSDSQTYYDAAITLLNYVVKKAAIVDTKKILNVACGYGAETFRLYEKFHPELLYAIDIT
jgi:ubiquinone/menaquinone biosynthesis C-methylase UbiE